MRNYTGAAVPVGALKTGPTVDELKLKMIEHVITHTSHRGSDDVWNILAETKGGSRRKLELMQKLTVVFSVI